MAWTRLTAELKELLESVPDLEDLPSYEEMMEPLLPTQGSVVVTSVEVKSEPQEPAVVTPMEPLPQLEPGAVLEPLPEPSPEPKVPLCPFHETPLGENQTRGDPSFRYVFCKEYDVLFGWWVWIEPTNGRLKYHHNSITTSKKDHGTVFVGRKVKLYERLTLIPLMWVAFSLRVARTCPAGSSNGWTVNGLTRSFSTDGKRPERLVGKENGRKKPVGCLK